MRSGYRRFWTFVAIVIIGCLLGVFGAAVYGALQAQHLYKEQLQAEITRSNQERAASDAREQALFTQLDKLHNELDQILTATDDIQRQQIIQAAAGVSPATSAPVIPQPAPSTMSPSTTVVPRSTPSSQPNPSSSNKPTPKMATTTTLACPVQTVLCLGNPLPHSSVHRSASLHPRRLA